MSVMSISVETNPRTASPSRSLPARVPMISAKVSSAALSATVALLTVASTGVSFAPLTVTVIVWLALAAVPSVALTLIDTLNAVDQQDAFYLEVPETKRFRLL